MINLHRAYDAKSPGRGPRFLVEQLWPRGIRKSDLPVDGWLKEVAPSTGLRQWFSHDPARWEEFRRRYFRELEANPGAWEPLVEAARQGDVTLVYSSRDTEHNNAVALKAFLEDKLRHSSKCGRMETRRVGGKERGSPASAPKAPHRSRRIHDEGQRGRAVRTDRGTDT